MTIVCGESSTTILNSPNAESTQPHNQEQQHKQPSIDIISSDTSMHKEDIKPLNNTKEHEHSTFEEDEQEETCHPSIHLDARPSIPLINTTNTEYTTSSPTNNNTSNDVTMDETSPQILNEVKQKFDVLFTTYFECLSTLPTSPQNWITHYHHYITSKFIHQFPDFEFRIPNCSTLFRLSSILIYIYLLLLSLLFTC